MSSGGRSDWVMKALAEHESPLLRYARSIVGPAKAEDVVQDVFLKLCSESKEAVEGHLAAWLFRVCRNRAIEVLRSDGRQRELVDGDDLPAPDSGPGGAFERKEALTRMGRALSRLTRREREVLALKVDSGLRYKEIAEVMNLSASNVGFILHGALKKLREDLAPDETTEAPRALARVP
jgi:RNA polymerase sigma-70 factor (ECF subfamily)